MKAPKNNIEENKPDMSLIPMDLLGKYLVPAYEEGLVKYYRDSWRLNFPHSVMIAAARRHLSEFWENGEDFDQDNESGNPKHHLAGVIFCCLAMLNVHDTGDIEKDDRRYNRE